MELRRRRHYVVLALLGVTFLPLSVSGQQRSNPPDTTEVSVPHDRRDDPAYLDKPAPVSPQTAPAQPPGAHNPWQIEDSPEYARYLETQIQHISDADLFAALDLDRPALAAVKKAVGAGDYPAAYRAWADYWAAKEKPAQAQSQSQRPGREQAPLTEAEARQQADPVMRHNITGWGGITHQHGDVVDFNFDYGWAGQYGFHYWGWVQPLLTAYHTTGDARYLAEFDRLFGQWYDQRDVVPARVIYDGLGLGIRILKFMQAYSCPYSERSLATHERMLKTLLGAGRALQVYCRAFRTGNHQTTGTMGLLNIVVCLPEFREAGQWRDTAAARLKDNAEHEFYADGMHIERVPGSYMGIVVRVLRDAIPLLQQAGVQAEALALFRQRLEKAYEWWMWALTPLGTLPALGDGGRASPAASLREGAKEFHRPDFQAVVERLVDDNKGPLPALPTATSVHLEPSGVAVMRSGWEREAAYLFLNYGTTDEWHTHRTSLDFELYAYGAPLALDAGGARTYDDPAFLTWYVTAKAHNMLVVDDANADRATARGHDVLWHSDPRLDVFAATHDGYLKSKGITHRRAIAFLKPDVFLVFDTCTADMDDRTVQDGHTLSWYFHSPTDLVVQPGGRVVSAAGPGVLLAAAWPEQLSVRHGKGLASLGGGRGDRGVRKEIDWIALDKPVRRGDDNRFAVLMLPFADKAPEVEFTAAPSPPGTACVTLRRGNRTDTLVFGSGKPLTLLDGRLITDGQFAWIREQDGVRQGRVVGGNTLSWAGQPLRALEK